MMINSSMSSVTSSTCSSSYTEESSLPSLLSHETSTSAALEAQLSKAIRNFGSNHQLVSRLWSLLGNNHLEHGQHKLAMAAYQESVLCGATGAHLTDAYSNIGKLHLVMGNSREAIDFFGCALNATLDCDTMKSSSAVAVICHYMGTSLALNGDLEQALEYLFESLAIYERVEDEDCLQVRAQLLNDISAIYTEIGDHQSALECRQDALRLF